MYSQGPESLDWFGIFYQEPNGTWTNNVIRRDGNHHHLYEILSVTQFSTYHFKLLTYT